MSMRLLSRVCARELMPEEVAQIGHLHAYQVYKASS